MSAYFFVIFKVHHITFRYNIFLEEYMGLSERSISSTALEDREPKRRTKKRGVEKNSNNNLTYSLIQQST